MTALRHICILATLVLGAGEASAQWTLERCIKYAQEHNITLKQQEGQTRQRSLDVSTAKNARLPDLNGSASENVSFGRGLTMDNTYANKTTSSTSLTLSTSVPILTGGRIPAQQRLARLNLEAATADLAKARESIALQVAAAYMQVVYGEALVAVARRQVGIDSLQVERLRAMLAVGKASRAELAQQEAAMAQSQLTLTTTENDRQLSLVSLSQLLELPTPDGLQVVIPATEIKSSPVPSPDAIYAEAVGIKSEIAAEQLRLHSSEQSIRLARAALYPQLSFGGSLSTSYYKTSGIVGEGFGKQLKNNFNQGIGLSLSIPIFNRLSTRNSIRSARIDSENQRLALENAKKALYKEIQQAYYNTVAADARLTSCHSALTSSEEAFTLMKAKYENGKANITEFNESKNNLLKAESDLERTRCECLYQRALIRFYQGREISLVE